MMNDGYAYYSPSSTAATTTIIMTATDNKIVILKNDTLNGVEAQPP